MFFRICIPARAPFGKRHRYLDHRPKNLPEHLEQFSGDFFANNRASAIAEEESLDAKCGGGSLRRPDQTPADQFRRSSLPFLSQSSNFVPNPRKECCHRRPRQRCRPSCPWPTTNRNCDAEYSSIRLHLRGVYHISLVFLEISRVPSQEGRSASFCLLPRPSPSRSFSRTSKPLRLES